LSLCVVEYTDTIGASNPSSQGNLLRRDTCYAKALPSLMLHTDIAPVTTRRGINSPSNSKSRINPTKKAFSPLKWTSAISQGINSLAGWKHKCKIAEQKLVTILSLKGGVTKCGSCRIAYNCYTNSKYESNHEQKFPRLS
jgi:hypothetical protein